MLLAVRDALGAQGRILVWCVAADQISKPGVRLEFARMLLDQPLQKVALEGQSIVKRHFVELVLVELALENAGDNGIGFATRQPRHRLSEGTRGKRKDEVSEQAKGDGRHQHLPAGELESEYLDTSTKRPASAWKVDIVGGIL